MMLGHTTMEAPDWAKVLTFSAGAGAVAAAALDILGQLGDKRPPEHSMLVVALKGAFIGLAAGALAGRTTLRADPSLHPQISGLGGWGAGWVRSDAFLPAGVVRVAPRHAYRRESKYRF